MKKGELTGTGKKTIGVREIFRNNSFEFFECNNCKTVYPEIEGQIKCNGEAITKCPWCRPDSRPWLFGRGE